MVEEKLESLTRRHETLLLDLEEFYSKVHKARQRVMKEDRDSSKSPASPSSEQTPEVLKAQLRASLNRRVNP